MKRKDKALDWTIRLDADQPIDVATQIVTFQPGGFSGWHTHPGPVFFTVRTGTLTVYEGDDPTCTPHVFAAGTEAVEAATNNHTVADRYLPERHRPFELPDPITGIY